MKFGCRFVFPALASLFCFPLALTAQNNFQPGQLDPTRNVASPQPADQGHTALPEQYIWSANHRSKDQIEKNAPMYFRVTFQVKTVPQQATLYVAGPEASSAYLDGKLVDKVQQQPRIAAENACVRDGRQRQAACRQECSGSRNFASQR